jgi:hypothetical protein
MAANDSPLTIANLALLDLGEEPISAIFPPDGSDRAAKAALYYHNVRRQVLRDGLWGCAKRDVLLAASTVTPPFGWGNAYPLPADYLRIVDSPEDFYWGRVGRRRVRNLANVGPCLLTPDAAPYRLTYIFDLQDCTQMTADLVMTIAKSLAAALAIPLAKDLQIKQDMEAAREGMLAVARTTSAQENAAVEWDVDVLLRSRF